MSIKHKLRQEVAEDLRPVRVNQPIGIDVDQTGMELHERCTRQVCNDGLLAPWLRLFAKTKHHINKEPGDTINAGRVEPLKVHLLSPTGHQYESHD